MPPVTTIPSEETDIDGELPFKIINNDNLGPIGIVKGEAIFKPFGKDNKLKPNIMVYPTRRANGNLEDSKTKQFAKSNGYIPNHVKNNNHLKKNFSNSHGNLTNHNNSANKKQKEIEPIKNDPGLDVNFTKALDAKLRKLQKEEKSRASSRLRNSPSDQTKKPFVTTVKKGEFLEPPPEYASLLGIRLEKEDCNKLYAYASRPRILQNNRVSTAGSNQSGVHRSKCEAAAIAAAMIASGVAGFREAASRAKRDINSNIRKET